MSENLGVLFLAFAEPEPRIDHDAPALNSGMTRPADSRIQIARDGADYVLHRGQFRPGFRRAPHVVQDEPGVAVHCNSREIRIERKSARIVEDFDSVLERSLGDL
jgi:hypothetical protein